MANELPNIKKWTNSDIDDDRLSQKLDLMENDAHTCIELATDALQKGDIDECKKCIEMYDIAKENLSLHHWGKDRLDALENAFSDTKREAISLFEKCISEVDIKNPQYTINKINSLVEIFGNETFIGCKPEKFNEIIENCNSTLTELKSNMKTENDYEYHSDLTDFVENAEELVNGESIHKKTRYNQLDLRPEEIKEMMNIAVREAGIRTISTGIREGARVRKIESIKNPELLRQYNDKLVIACSNILSPLQNGKVDRRLALRIDSNSRKSIKYYESFEKNYLGTNEKSTHLKEISNNTVRTSLIDEPSIEKHENEGYKESSDYQNPDNTTTTNSEKEETKQNSNDNNEISLALKDALESMRICHKQMQEILQGHNLEEYINNTPEQNIALLEKETLSIDADIAAQYIEIYKSVISEFSQYYKEQTGKSADDITKSMKDSIKNEGREH